MNNIKKKVIVAMSGGVDSSITAWLLKKQNYYVEGLFMKNWEENDTKSYCSSKKNLKDLKIICKQLNIYLHKINFSYEYWNKVFKIFLQEYKKGRTPNPDVLCNKEIKFKIFYKFAINILKADYIATGHYARNKNIKNTQFLLRAKDINKDQVYFLYTLNHILLKKIIFPLGEINKNIVRKIAKKINMIIANKKSSTGICFIEPKNFKNFLNIYIPFKKGLIKTIFGIILGFHKGLAFYTIGQRKGINIGGIKNTINEPWFVVDKNIIKNELIIAQGKNNIYLQSYGFIIINPYWINYNNYTNKIFCKVQIRYHKICTKCVIYFKKKYIKIILKKNEYSVTIGQSAVFYKSNNCIGGGVIEKIFLINKNKYK